MAKHRDYIPKGKYELLSWAKGFIRSAKAKIDSYGIEQEQYDALEQMVETYAKDMQAENRLIDQKRAQVKKSQADRRELVRLSRSMAQVIKNNREYTDVVGRGFDIAGAEVQKDVANSKPVLKAKKVAQAWAFAFGLEDYFDGVNIYRKTPEQEEFTYLISKTKSPYIDGSEKQVGTQYCAYFLLGDTEVGQQSDIVTLEI